MAAGPALSGRAARRNSLHRHAGVLMADTPQLSAADVSLNDYLDIVRRRRWIIIQTFAVVAAIGLITTMMATPIYRATPKPKVEAAPLTITTQNSDNPLSSILT